MYTYIFVCVLVSPHRRPVCQARCHSRRQQARESRAPAKAPPRRTFLARRRRRGRASCGRQRCRQWWGAPPRGCAAKGRWSCIDQF